MTDTSNCRVAWEVRAIRSRGTTAAAASRWLRGTAVLVVWVLVLLLPGPAAASFLSPELEDKLADILAMVVIFIVPVIGIVVFWMLHVLPEKIAHKRHHPQFEAIRTLCLLSLAFGGLLWPIAWLWAYTKPVAYKMAYGTDKHPDYYQEQGLPDPGESHAPALEQKSEA